MVSICASVRSLLSVVLQPSVLSKPQASLPRLLTTENIRADTEEGCVDHNGVSVSGEYSVDNQVNIGEPGFEPGITRSQSGHVSRYTIPRQNKINTTRL